MKAPDRIYIHEASAPFLDVKILPPYGIEYIRKEALLEWATMNRDRLDALSDNDAWRWGLRNAFQQMIDKLNEM